MIKSMTGFGKASGNYGARRVTVEIKSLNSKSLDLSLRLPYIYKDKDTEVRTRYAKDLERGKIDFLVYFEEGAVIKKHSINIALAKEYYTELLQLEKETGTQTSDYPALIMRMPDILNTEESDIEEEEWLAVNKIIGEAIAAFNKFREDEGRILEAELVQRIRNIRTSLDEVEKLDPERIVSIKTRIQKSLNELIGNDKVDQNRFEQELIFYIERLDITEEKLRLKTHCDYFLETLSESSNNGKKLGFITQEIGREINTIGSKANDVNIQRLVVQMKDELEKIKEQSLNVL